MKETGRERQTERGRHIETVRETGPARKTEIDIEREIFSYKKP
jgi:hypothetical protein